MNTKDFIKGITLKDGSDKDILRVEEFLKGLGLECEIDNEEKVAHIKLPYKQGKGKGRELTWGEVKELAETGKKVWVEYEEFNPSDKHHNFIGAFGFEKGTHCYYINGLDIDFTQCNLNENAYEEFDDGTLQFFAIGGK